MGNPAQRMSTGFEMAYWHVALPAGLFQANFAHQQADLFQKNCAILRGRCPQIQGSRAQNRLWGLQKG